MCIELMKSQEIEAMRYQEAQGELSYSFLTTFLGYHNPYLCPVMERLEIEQVDDAHHLLLGRFNHQSQLIVGKDIVPGGFDVLLQEETRIRPRYVAHFP